MAGVPYVEREQLDAEGQAIYDRMPPWRSLRIQA
jgi:hypothetical protein